MIQIAVLVIPHPDTLLVSTAQPLQIEICKKYPLTPPFPPQSNSLCKAAQLKLQSELPLNDRAVWSTGVPIITQAGHMHNFFFHAILHMLLFNFTKYPCLRG